MPSFFVQAASAPALTGMLSGEVDFMFVSILTVTPLIRDGRLRAIAVSSADRNKALPNVPAMGELPMLKGAESDLWYGMLAPAQTPKDIIARLHGEAARILHMPDIKERFVADGTDPVGNTPEEFGRYIRDETVKWAKVARDAGIKQE